MQTRHEGTTHTHGAVDPLILLGFLSDTLHAASLIIKELSWPRGCTRSEDFIWCDAGRIGGDDDFTAPTSAAASSRIPFPSGKSEMYSIVVWDF